MIKVLLGSDGAKQTLILGITDDNIHRILNGKPLTVETAELGLPPLTIIVHHSATHTTLLAELAAAGIVPPDLPPSFGSEPKS